LRITELPKAQEIFQNVKPQYFSPEKLFVHLELTAHEKPKLWPFRNLAFAFFKLAEAACFYFLAHVTPS